MLYGDGSLQAAKKHPDSVQWRMQHRFVYIYVYNKCNRKLIYLFIFIFLQNAWVCSGYYYINIASVAAAKLWKGGKVKFGLMLEVEATSWTWTWFVPFDLIWPYSKLFGLTVSLHSLPAIINTNRSIIHNHYLFVTCVPFVLSDLSECVYTLYRCFAYDETFCSKKSTTSIMQLKLTVKLVGSFVFRLNSSAYEPAALLIALFIV